MKRSIYSFVLAALAAAAAGSIAASAQQTNEITVGGPGAPVKLNLRFGTEASSTNKTPAVTTSFKLQTGDTTLTLNQPWIWAGKDLDLKEGQTANDVVVIGRNATIAGKVKDNVTVVFGSVTLKPTAVIGSDMVVVGGSVHAASNAVVRGDVVIVGGGIKAEPGFRQGGERVILSSVEFGPQWLRNWANNDLLRGVLLPWSAMESWILIAVALAFNLLLSLLFPKSLQTCTDTAREKPVQSFLLGLLLLAAFGPVCLLFMISCIGVLAIPFLVFAVLAAMVFGFVAVYRVVGRPLARLVGGTQAERPLLSLVIGTVICNLACMLPVVGVIAWGLVMMLGFGAASLALFGRPRRQAPLPPPAVAPPMVVSQPVMAAVPPIVPPAVLNAVPVTASAVPPLEVTTLPRPGFWMRIGAALLDCFLISMLASFSGARHGSEVFTDSWATLLLMVYLVGLWTWRGTTIGNIVFGLKIVRTDGQPVTLGVAVVRALASLLSLAVIGLGFFWIAWDREKQAWHDKIAGTLVVRMPRGVSLI